jgi:hypothetical protein
MAYGDANDARVPPSEQSRYASELSYTGSQCLEHCASIIETYGGTGGKG